MGSPRDVDDQARDEPAQIEPSIAPVSVPRIGVGAIVRALTDVNAK